MPAYIQGLVEILEELKEIHDNRPKYLEVVSTIENEFLPIIESMPMTSGTAEENYMNLYLSKNLPKLESASLSESQRQTIREIHQSTIDNVVGDIYLRLESGPTFALDMRRLLNDSDTLIDFLEKGYETSGVIDILHQELRILNELKVAAIKVSAADYYTSVRNTMEVLASEHKILYLIMDDNQKSASLKSGIIRTYDALVILLQSTPTFKVYKSSFYNDDGKRTPLQVTEKKTNINNPAINSVANLLNYDTELWSAGRVVGPDDKKFNDLMEELYLKATPPKNYTSGEKIINYNGKLFPVKNHKLQ